MRFSHAMRVLLFLVAAAIISIAQQEYPTSASALLQSAGAPDATNVYGVTVIQEDISVKIDAAMRTTQRYRLVYRIDSPDAVEAWSSVGIRWSPWHQKKPTVRARVITPDGKQHELDPKNLSDTPARDQRPETFDDERVVSGPLPAVKVGAVVEEEEILEDTQPFFSAGLVRRSWFGRTNPVQYHRLTLEAPTSVPLKYSIISGPKITVKKEEQQGTTRLIFEQVSAPAFENEESNLPSDVSTWPYVVFSTARSWNDVAANYNATVEKQIGAADLKDIAAKHAGSDRMATIANLLAYLHGEVRYTGVEFNEATLVPRTPAETFQRKFGDCKDKAAALVALLRAAGIPANLALLNTGPGLDVDAGHPGMGVFDHAIVYVPGTPELWIDATAEFHRAGSLPYADQGRMALVVAADSAALRRTPEDKSGDNLIVEHREFQLPAYGKAKVTEITDAIGDADAFYRASYGGGESKEVREQLDSYMKTEYLADGLSRYEHGDGADLRKPFHLKLETAKAKRGDTSSESAVVAIRFEGLFYRMPQYLKVSEEDEKERDGEAVVQKKAPRTVDVVFQPYVTEWRYKVTVPAGFRARALPPHKTQSIGPAVLSYSFAVENDGTVSGVVRLDSVKGRYTVAEAQSTRKAYKELVSGDPLLLTFEEIGTAEFAAGNVRAALGAERQMVAQSPKDAIAHTRLARILLLAGLGEQARDEAKQAVKLDPKSAVAYRTLAWVLQHDLIGRRHKKGFDHAGAVAAYRKAIELDPKDTEVRADLAYLLCFDSDGESFSPKAKLDDAIAEYREIGKIDEETGHAYDDSILSALTYAKRFKEAAAMVADLPQTQQRLAVQLLSIAASEGAAAAIEKSKVLARDSTVRNPALKMAGMTMRDLRMYALAADLLAAGAEGDPNAPQILGQVQAFRNARKAEEIIDRKKPASAIQRMFFVLVNPTAITPEVVKEFEYTFDVPNKYKAETMMRAGGSLRLMFERAEMSRTVATDLIISNMKLTTEGDDAQGYRIRVQPIGAKMMTAFIARSENGYKMLGADKDVTGVGVEALRHLQAGDIAGAKHWLDWAREEVSIPGGDDPLAWPAFPRLYARGEAADPARIRRAALSLVADTEYGVPYLAEIKDLVAKASDADRPILQTVLASAYRAGERWTDLEAVASALLEAQPTSEFAFSALVTACVHTKDWKTWETSIAKRLERLPDDHMAIRSRASLWEMQGKFEQARAVLKSLLDTGRATESDMNSFGWDALFLGKVGAEDVDIVQRASGMSQNGNYAVVHTLACLYAEVGKTKDARELLLHTLAVGGLDEPDTTVWYGLARLAEEYGEHDAAIRAYQRMEARDNDVDQPTSTWNLGQKRLRALQASMQQEGGKSAN